MQNKIIVPIKQTIEAVYNLFESNKLKYTYKEDFGKDYYIGMEMQRIVTFPLMSIFGSKHSLISLEYKFDLFNGYNDELTLPLQ